jgi:hypothetical protein
MLTLIPIVSSLLAYSSYAAAKPISYLSHNFWGQNRKVRLALLRIFSLISRHP